jgi:hypothetical protein
LEEFNAFFCSNQNYFMSIYLNRAKATVYCTLVYLGEAQCVHCHFHRFYTSTGSIKGADNSSLKNNTVGLIFCDVCNVLLQTCTLMNQSLIPPFTGAEIVKANLKGKVKMITLNLS